MRKYKSAARTGTDENRRKVTITKNPAPLMLIRRPQNYVSFGKSRLMTSNRGSKKLLSPNFILAV